MDKNFNFHALVPEEYLMRWYFIQKQTFLFVDLGNWRGPIKFKNAAWPEKNRLDYFLRRTVAVCVVYSGIFGFIFTKFFWNTINPIWKYIASGSKWTAK